MKIWWTTFLAIIIFASSFQSSLVLLDYHINQDFYETHCENKDKPELQCNGKCQLNKENDTKNGIYLVAKFCFEMNLLPIHVEYKITKPNIKPELAIVFTNYTQPTLKGFLKRFPHPPQI